MILGEWFVNLSPVIQALLATCFTWGLTALGAAGVFLSKEVSRRALDMMLGFAAGVMIAASYWCCWRRQSTCRKTVRYRHGYLAAVGFLLGAAFLRGLDWCFRIYI